MPAAREDHGFARADANRRARLLDVAVLPEAAHQLAGLGMHARRVRRLDADDAARERLLAHELREFAEQHELHTFLARRELERARQGCPRSEERRVGKECRTRWSPEH